jgi:hypothetical protein
MNLQKTLKKLLKNKDTSNQYNFIYYLEGIGDVLSSETRRKNNRLVFDGLEKINDIILKTFEIRKSNPKKFTKLIYENEIAEILARNEDNAKLLIEINPNKYLIGFSTSINQIFRVYESANNLKSKETKEISLGFIIRILSFLSNSSKENEIFIKHILNKFLEIIIDSIKYNNEQDIPPALFEWYIAIIFNSTAKKDDSFNIEYLKLFNYYFGWMIRYVISEHKLSLFKLFINSLNGFNLLPYRYASDLIWNIQTMAYREANDKKNNEFSKTIDSIFNEGKYIDSVEDFKNWTAKLKDFESNIKPIFNEEQEKKAQDIYGELSIRVLLQLKYNNVINTAFEIGTYCLFKEKYSYIRYLWEYKQPSDADSKWVGPDIIPENLENVIRLYFKKDSWLRKFIIFEDHHGSEIYFKKYLILLLIKTLQASKTLNLNAIVTYINQTKNIDFNFLSRMDIYLLNDIIHSINELKEAANGLKDYNMLYEIGLINSRDDKKEFDIIFNDISDFLDKLKNESEKLVTILNQSQPLSGSKISSFKEGFINGLYESANMRKSFTYLFGSFKDETSNDNEGIRNKLRFGTAVTENRAAFFDEWYVSYSNIAEAIGRNFGIDENTELFKQITQCCSKISIDEIDGRIEKFNNINDVVMLTTFSAIFELFEITKDKRYKQNPNRINNPFSDKSDDKTINSLCIGYFNFNGTEIPIYETGDTRTVQNQLLILDKTNTGSLTQYTPLFPSEDKNLIMNGFLINILDLANHNNQPDIESMVENFIKNPSGGLKNIENEEERRDYLKGLVLMQIYERFEFAKANDFIGYRLY